MSEADAARKATYTGLPVIATCAVWLSVMQQGALQQSADLQVTCPHSLGVCLTVAGLDVIAKCAKLSRPAVVQQFPGDVLTSDLSTAVRHPSLA